MAKKKAARVKSAGKTTNDPAQQTLPGVDEPRITMVETSVKRLLAIKTDMTSLKEEKMGLLDKISGLLQKNGIKNYKCLGKEVFLEPGSPIVKIKTAKAQA